MRIAITSQNLDPKIVVSGISTVVKTITMNSRNDFFVYEVGYRDGDKKNLNWLFKQIRLILKFNGFLKDNRIEVVHINIPFDTLGIVRDFIFFSLSKFSRKKILLHIHGGKFLMIRSKNVVVRFLIGLLLRNADKVLVLSKIEKEIVLRNYLFGGCDYLENGVDTSSIKFRHFSPISNTNQRKFRLLFLARITESKGIDDVLEAFRILYSKIKFQFVLCGSGDRAVEVSDKFKEFMGNDFLFSGVVSGAEKWQTIYLSDIFLLPSRHSEGLPMALLETMAAGVIPVVTDEASMREIVFEGYNGLIVKKYDGVNLAKQLGNLMLNDELMEKYSANARKSIVEKYDSKIFINKLEEFYRNL